MEHEKTIHLNIYRQPVGTNDILEVSQFLEKAQNEFVETTNGRIQCEGGSLSDMDEDDDEDEHPPSEFSKKLDLSKSSAANVQPKSYAKKSVQSSEGI